MKRNLLIITIAAALQCAVFIQARIAAIETAARCQNQPQTELESWGGHITYIPCH